MVATPVNPVVAGDQRGGEAAVEQGGGVWRSFEVNRGRGAHHRGHSMAAHGRGKRGAGEGVTRGSWWPASDSWRCGFVGDVGGAKGRPMKAVNGRGSRWI
jgi:hypothetical protein